MRRVLAGLVAASLGVFTVAFAHQAEASVAPAGALNTSDVTANLWEWNWPSVAAACTGQLGPAGYGAVQVAPPEESITLPSSSDGAHPWWEGDQPVSYQSSSRLGTRAQFASMVSACHAAGVRVYADAVINHTAGDNNTFTSGYGGSTFSPTRYGQPGVPDPAARL